MKLILYTFIVICILCGADTVKVKDLTKSERISSDKSSADLQKSTTSYTLNKAENDFGDSSSSNIKLGRYSPRFGNTRLNIIGSRISQGSDFNYPGIYNTGNLNKDIFDDRFDNAAPYENVSFEEGDEKLRFHGNVVNFPKGLSRGSLEISRKGINLDELDTELGNSNLGISGRESSQPKDELLDNTDVELYTPIVIHLGDTDHSERDDIANKKGYHKGSGSNFKVNHETSSGKEESKGYKTTEDFDKKEKGVVQNARHAERYDGSAGIKQGVKKESKKYADKEAASEGEKSESFGQSKGHKKGHKTTGFHNVYHKDEYKKDTSFYDDEHESQHEEAHGSEDSRHIEVEGAHERNEKFDAAHHQDQHGKKKVFTNGHQYGVSRGHDIKEGEKEVYENEAEYSKGANHRLARKKGISSESSYA